MGTRLKPITIVCAICRKPFETRATNAKNCPDCRKIAEKESKRKYKETHTKPKAIPIWAGDTERQRKTCLSCDVPVEKCKGWCSKLEEG